MSGKNRVPEERRAARGQAWSCTSGSVGRSSAGQRIGRCLRTIRAPTVRRRQPHSARQAGSWPPGTPAPTARSPRPSFNLGQLTDHLTDRIESDVHSLVGYLLVAATAMPETMYCNGIPSGSGLPGVCQASVQSLRNMRHGFPVKERLRTVSRLLALTYAACWTGVFSASSTISHCEPDHAPWQPMASAAAICS